MNDHINTNELSKTLSGRIIYLVGMMGSGKSKTGPYLAKSLGYRFVDTELLFQALTHRSWCAENGGASNERLEFLGEA